MHALGGSVSATPTATVPVPGPDQASVCLAPYAIHRHGWALGGTRVKTGRSARANPDYRLGLATGRVSRWAHWPRTLVKALHESRCIHVRTLRRLGTGLAGNGLHSSGSWPWHALIAPIVLVILVIPDHLLLLVVLHTLVHTTCMNSIKQLITVIAHYDPAYPAHSVQP